MAIDFKSIWKRVVIALIISAVIFVLVSTYLVVGCYSNGERVGNIIKFSEKGMAFKTWEGELIQRNLSTQADTWIFSVKDDTVANQINEAMRQNHRVSIRYCEKYYKFPWDGDTKYFIEKVIILPQ